MIIIEGDARVAAVAPAPGAQKPSLCTNIQNYGVSTDTPSAVVQNTVPLNNSSVVVSSDMLKFGAVKTMSFSLLLPGSY